MGYHQRIECTKVASFQTTRTRNSELWFANCPPLEDAILGYAAKYCKTYEVKLYAFAIEGTHIQFPALYPKANRAHFMRDLNSAVARAVPRYQKTYPGGALWGRRYSAEYLPGEKDIEEQFFYTVLQPVQDNLCDDIRRYRGYNCFEDAVTGRSREYKVVRWKEYNDARRWRKDVSIEDFTDRFELTYERLPGYEELSQDEYAKMMRKKLRQRTKEIIAERKGESSAGDQYLRNVVPGARAKNPKVSTIRDHRPRVLSKDPDRRRAGNDWYFTIHFNYKQASKEYRSGNLDVEFPEGTYKPPLFTVAFTETIR